MKKLDALALKTKNVLITLSKLEELNQFTFVGGSALSVYLKHRISEDLDFFSWENELRNEALLREIKSTFSKGFKIETLNKKQLNLKIEDVKITFFANNWQELKKNEKLTGSINKKLFQTALVFTDDITEDNINHLKPKYDVNPDKIRKSFEDQIYEWIKR